MAKVHEINACNLSPEDFQSHACGAGSWRTAALDVFVRIDSKLEVRAGKLTLTEEGKNRRPDQVLTQIHMSKRGPFPGDLTRHHLNANEIEWVATTVDASLAT